MSPIPLVFLIAGEASGDQLGADLMHVLRKNQEVRFAGIGGEAMRAEGLTSLFPMEDLSIMGLWGILQNLPQLWKRLNFTVKTIELLKPDVVVTIDAPEFNFRVMKRLYKMNPRPRLIHYVAPTVWAWRPRRAKKISRFLDQLLCLYPFEPPYFEKYGLKSTFVGHPAAKEKLGKKKRDPNLLCILPGSRPSEIETLLPIFRQTLKFLKEELLDLKVIIPTLASVEDLVYKGTHNWPVPVKIVVGNEGRKEAFQKASVALAASGTVALQLSAARLPFVIAYKINKLNEWIAKALLKTPWVCMVNILLAFQKFGFLQKHMNEQIEAPWIPEFLQEECVAEKLAPTLLNLLKNQDIRTHQIEAMEKAIFLLKAPRQAVGLSLF